MSGEVFVAVFLALSVATCLATGITDPSVEDRDQYYYVTTTQTTQSYGSSAELHYNGPRDSSTETVYRHLSAEMMDWDENVCRIRVQPSSVSTGQETPYVIPDTVFEHSSTPASNVTKPKKTNYKVSVEDPSDVVVATSTGEEIFRLGNLVFREQEIRFDMNTQSSSYLSGWGEHNYYYFLNHNHLANTKSYTNNSNAHSSDVRLGLWNTDNGGTPWHRPLYGVHPVLFVQQPKTDTYFAVFFANSHASGLTIKNKPYDFPSSKTTFGTGAQGLTFDFMGGIIDAWIIIGSSPLEVIQRYHKIIQPTLLPPYWSLGVHQSRWGYKNVAALKAVVQGYKDAKLPLEVMWNDIDYMNKFRIFTTDPINYPEAELRAFVDSLHADGLRYVQIIDPGVAAQNYSVYRNGTANDVFVKLPNNETLINVVWPGWTAFPDFTSAKAREWWGDQMATYMASIPIDGAWLDMNELGTFCGGYCPVPSGAPWEVDWQQPGLWDNFVQEVCVAKGNCTQVDSVLNFPKVALPTDSQYPFLFNRTLDMAGELAMGRYYNTKAFYGMMEEKATYDQLAKNKTRPFILSRASFAGSGRFTAHWTGDNAARWGPTTGGLADSWQGVLSANLWGISMVGSDIGGYGGKISHKLTTRWTQAGAFYTFMRNHHEKDQYNPEPYTATTIEIDAMRRAMLKRYELLPYIFTELAKSHFLGGPVSRHLSVQFPNDIANYDESTNFMLGDALLVMPIVSEEATTLSVRLPQGPWYDLWTYETVSLAGLRPFTFDATFDPGTLTISDVPCVIRGGSIVPLHTAAKMTVGETRATGISLVAAMDQNGFASGEAWFDDGKESLVAAGANERNGALLVMRYQCRGTPEAGRCEAQLLNYGPAPHSFPLSGKINASLTILFPLATNGDTSFGNVSAAAVFPLPKQVRLNGTAITLASATATSTRLVVALPQGTDGTTAFDLVWTQTPIVAPTPPPPPAPKGSPVAALAVVIAILALVAGGAIVAVVYFRTKARAAESDSFMLH